MPTRRDFLKTASALAAAPLMARADDGKRPDVLFIAIEDVSPHRFGCHGNTVCQTPNIDRFAAQNLRFDNAHTNPPCCPSRTALFLGRRPETTKVFGNMDDWHKTSPGALTFPVHFQNNGYETIRCGKMYHGDFEDDASWNRNIQPHEGMPERKSRRRALEGPGEELAREINDGKRTGGSPFLYGPTGVEDWEEKDGGVAEQGIRLLAEKSAKPRLMCLGFHATHLAFAAPDKYFEPYPADEMVIPMNPGADETGMPRDRSLLTPNNPHTLDQWRKAIAAHYACASFVDAQVGRVLDALEKSGRADDTIVVIWSDHGFMLGEHFLWRKGPLYEESTRVLMLMKAPGLTKPGTVCKRPVETIDVFPTMSDLCGIPQPPDIEAMSMRPILQDPGAPWKKGALMWGGKTRRSIVTDRWRYNEYIGRSEKVELFDHDNDPKEFTNLAADAGRADEVARLSGLLKGGWKACLPDSA
jgi:iduronate 2-sulfatase